MGQTGVASNTSSYISTFACFPLAFQELTWAGWLPAGGPEELWGHFQPVFFQLLLNHQQGMLMLEQIPEPGAVQERFRFDKNILQGSQDQLGVLQLSTMGREGK